MAMGETQTVEKEKFTIRPYEDSDQTAVLALWADVFGKELPESLWRWKYSENPYGHRIMLSVKPSGEILAFFGGIPYLSNWDGRKIEMLQLMDIMSHPWYRGGGFFVRTVLAFIETYTGMDASPLLYGFPGRQHFDIGEKYLQYRHIKEGAVYLEADLSDRPADSGPYPVEASPVRYADEVFDRLWEQCRPYYPLAVIRDRRFVKWRFFDHPQREYEIWGCYDAPGRELKGYAAVTMDEENRPVIADWLCVPEKQRVAGFLAGLMSAYQQRGKTRLITWLPSGCGFTEMFVSAGFCLQPEPIGFIPTARSFARELSIEWVLDHIYYTMADGDLF